MHRVQRYHPITGIADIIFLCPARRAGPSPAQGALPQFGIRKRPVAEVAEEPGETCRIFVRIISLLPDTGDILPDAGYHILLLRPAYLTT